MELRTDLTPVVKVAISLLLDLRKQEMLRAIRVCESPIEQLMSLFLHHFKELYERNYHISIIPQKKIGKYRVDFLVNAYTREEEPKLIKQVVVECDGHSFHEKTKEQARHDKERDRYLQAQGYTVLRYTGSEIFQNAGNCADEVFQILLSGKGGNET